MTNVNFFADKETNKRTGQKLYAPDLSMRGHKNLLCPTTDSCGTAVFTHRKINKEQRFGHCKPAPTAQAARLFQINIFTKQQNFGPIKI